MLARNLAIALLPAGALAAIGLAGCQSGHDRNQAGCSQCQALSVCAKPAVAAPAAAGEDTGLQSAPSDPEPIAAPGGPSLSIAMPRPGDDAEFDSDRSGQQWDPRATVAEEPQSGVLTQMGDGVRSLWPFGYESRQKARSGDDSAGRSRGRAALRSRPIPLPLSDPQQVDPGHLAAALVPQPDVGISGEPGPSKSVTANSGRELSGVTPPSHAPAAESTVTPPEWPRRVEPVPHVEIEPWPYSKTLPEQPRYGGS